MPCRLPQDDGAPRLIRAGAYLGAVAVYRVGARDQLLRVRFAVSPLWETLAAVRALVDDDHRRFQEPWLDAVGADAVERHGLEPLVALQWPKGYVPDFLTPPPEGPAPRLRDQLALVRATPLVQVEEELRRRLESAPGARTGVEPLLADPARALERLADLMQVAWRELVAPFWPRIRALLDGEVDARSRTLARHGLRRLFDELHPRIRWSAEGVVCDRPGDDDVELDERGLVLMPSAFVWPAVASIVDPPWQPTIAYPARGIAELWRSPAPPPQALARLLGPTRAMLLAALDEPRSTTTLAALTELSPAGVSRHLLVLRDAGLLASRRRGHEVRYARTPLGDSILRGAVR
jgi:DNA-binding transcriptional ArsR family regulator